MSLGLLTGQTDGEWLLGVLDDAMKKIGMVDQDGCLRFCLNW